MSGKRGFVKAFGRTESGQEDSPAKIGSARASRIVHGDTTGCVYCFPHGIETYNNIWTKDLRCWKRYRKTQYRPIEAPAEESS